MDCPVCKDAMITAELADVEIDYCSSCRGIWLDRGELEMLLADGEKAHRLLESFKVDQHCREKPRRCPICDRKMQKVLVGSDRPKLLIDRCPRGDGLWFDGGELQNIVQRATLDTDNRIARLLTDMFGCEPDTGNT